ncbi:MAG: PEP-CTERM sorting domain-containing protein [Pirellulales bacterium]|nr:PEP-CTERM sorting domain-containing protein [Pirellulales bacterium]
MLSTAFSLAAPSVQAATVLQLEFSGTFRVNIGSGHNEHKLEETFTYRITFDDTNITGAGTDNLTVSSIVSNELLVNGSSVQSPPIAPQEVDFELGPIVATVDGNHFGALAHNQTEFGSTLRGDSPLILAVGPTIEFNDFLALDGASILDGFSVALTVGGPTPADGIVGISTNLSVSVVPEPSIMVLLGLVGAAFFIYYRRRKALLPQASLAAVNS